MKTRALLLVPVFLFFSALSTQAAPLTDFEGHSVSIDAACATYMDTGSASSRHFGATVPLNKDWALQYRQTRYEPGNYSAKNQEWNVVHKLSPRLQVYSGYNTTSSSPLAGAPSLSDKKSFHSGIIYSQPLGHKTTLYTNLGGGDNVANVEFGLAYHVSKSFDINATYRHLSVEKIDPSGGQLNLRGFYLGMTWNN